MASKKKAAKKKKSSKKTAAPAKDATPPEEQAAPPEDATPAPELDGDAKPEEKTKANETPKETEAKPRLWYVEPVTASTLKTKHGVLIKGRPKPVPEGSDIYEFYKARADVRLFASSEG